MKLRINKMVLVVMLIFLILGMGTWIYLQFPRCDALDIINASVTVKTIGTRAFLGFNTDTDSLRFGVVSPGTLAQRPVTVGYSRQAQVTISPQGELAPWMKVEPAQFNLAGDGEKQEVQFFLDVPPDAADGNYTGKVYFCFKE